ncbi:hypothetical protein [Blastococcus xanthinilyticus]|uniref:Catalytic LigB subunit of aromatic ring-opening dioxygenase n=1 Tax=Blastococcus xanthinilyticus TaxID=1564164 RepID=A0A5S5CMW6_9ACTN|nr:hypothetical protein [Blastococcus xanthinilyticus]TYP83687.1 hypothetical protein BD833_11645 [Blastococcus xanthinilyticus]
MTLDPGGSEPRTPRPSAAVAFCPCPPLLLPAVEGRSAPETLALRSACADAVAALLTAAPEVVIVVGPGAAPGERFGPGDGGDLRGFGVDVALRFDGWLRPGGRRLPLAHTVGSWLLDEASFPGTRLGVGPDDLGQLLRDLPAPVGVLAMGDGSARRTVKAPGYLDPAAAPYDAAVSAALAGGDAAALAGLDQAEGARLLAAGVPTWRAIGAAFAGRHVTARLRHDAAPFGVGYPVADWVVA